MRKTIITSLALLASVCASGQKIRVVETINPIEENSFEKSLGSDWAEIDSLVIKDLYYTLEEKEFRLIRKCCEEGRLSGIDMSLCHNREIPANALSPQSSGGSALRKSRLRYVTLPSGLKSIDAGAFKGTGLVSIDIPRTVETIGALAFGNCPGLRSVTIRGNRPMTGVSADAFACSSSDAVLNVYPAAAGYYIESDVWKGFKGINADGGIYRELTVHFDGTRTARELLGGYAAGIDSLTVTGIPTMDDLDFIGTLSSLDGGRMHGLNLLDCDIDILWDDCLDLGTTRILSIVLPKNLRRIGTQAFASSMVEHVSFPPTLEEIDMWAFYGCFYLSGDLKFSEGLKFIGVESFNTCFNLKSIYLPSTLARIGKQAFYMRDPGDKGHDVYINRMSPPETVDRKGNVTNGISDSPFGPALAKNWRLFVPLGARAAYEAHPHWKHFGEIVETPELTGGPNAVDGVTAPDNGNGVSEVYTLSSRLVWRGSGTPSLQKGLYIVKENGRAVKRIVE